LYADRSFEMMIGLLGILKAGGAYVPLDPSYPSDRLSHMIEDSGVELVITQQHLIDSLPKGSVQASYRPIALDSGEIQQQLSHYVQENIDPALIGLTSKHLAYVIYTSGTTGKPKGVMLQHDGLVSLADHQSQSFGILNTSRVLQFASLSFDAAVWEWVLTLSVGACFYLYSREVILDPARLSIEVADSGITHAMLTPTFLPHLELTLWENVQALIVGGDQCALEVGQAWSANRRFFNAYGPTEATINCCVFEYKGSPSILPIGRPISNIEVYVLSPEQQLLPIGVPGELYIGGVGLARGYLNRPELTAEKFIAHPFCDDPEARLYRTGDLVRWLPDGNLAFLGRLDHQVKIRGFRIELGEIESQLLCEPSVKEAVVLAREDRGDDKRLAAYVTAAETPEALDEGALIESLRQRLKAVLPDYMLPSAFVVLEHLPLTPNGKVDRKALPEPDLAQVTETYEAPKSLTEARLAELWQTLLYLNSPVSRDAHFFELGGHSLLGVRLLASIREQFALDIPIKTLFAQPILSELAAVLDAEALTAGQGAQVPPMVAREPQ
ncbi:non-ribosomal peptide synthetase, partial [Vibrio caribbeanicus]|uniref:non-ribosomal peptide synthetase n=1 Tax=Vibrio caribbeanicus TaxID=701175 RepID=UPI000586535F